MTNNIEWIFFDIGSTLIDEKKAYEHRIKDIIYGSNVTYDEFFQTMIKFYKENKKGDLEAAKKFGLTMSKWHSEDEMVYPEAKKCLKLLKKKYKIGIIANQVAGCKERLKDHGVLKYIDLIIASAEEGISKPDLKIFNLALKRAECLPQNAIMIGDRLDNDIVPAKSLGMHTIWLKQGFSKFCTFQNEFEKPDYIFNNLNDVCSYLQYC